MRAVNLLPPDLRGPAKAAPAMVPAEPAGRGVFVLLGALALCVLALAGYVLAGNTVKQRQADLAQLETRHQAATARAATLKPYAEFDALAKARVATVRELAGVRFDWEGSLRDLSRAVPGDVTLKSLTGSATGATDGGAAAAGTSPVPTIKLEGCTRSQTGVARLMARLRAVNGVTRVGLAKSEKSQTDSAAAAGGDSATAAAAAPCGVGDTPDFSVTAYFGGAVAAATAPGAGAAGAATTPAPGATATPAPGATATPTPAPSDSGSTAAAPSAGGAE
jgi:Tfp pilus assembly protein PilN